jgi:hypothetical protein
MKRGIVFILLLALPIRAVLAVSGIGCMAMPSMAQHAAVSDGSPCPMHEGQPAESGSSTETCSSCDAACCAALAPESVPPLSAAAAVNEPLFLRGTGVDQVAQSSLERPPKAL